MMGALNTSIITMSHTMPKASVMPKPLTDALARKNSVSAETMVDQVGIDGREDAMTHAGDGGSTDAAAHANLLAEALKGKDGGVGSHADGQHDAAMPAMDRLNRPKCESRARMPRYSTANTAMAQR